MQRLATKEFWETFYQRQRGEGVDWYVTGEVLAAVVRRHFSCRRSKDSFDAVIVGCGTGDEGDAIADIIGSDARVLCVDFSETAIREKKKKKKKKESRCEFAVADARDLSVLLPKDGSVDIWCDKGCADALESDASAAYALFCECRRVLSPEVGRAIVVTPDSSRVLRAANAAGLCCVAVEQLAASAAAGSTDRVLSTEEMLSVVVLKSMFLRPVARSELLANAPCTAFLARYGGGDALQIGAMLASVELDAALIPEELKSAVVSGAKRVHAALHAVPEEERIARLPTEFDSSWKWEFHASISRLPAGGQQTSDSRLLCNIFVQAWLFDAELRNDPGALGRSAWPLIGVFGSPVGFLSPSDDDAAAGFDGEMHAADQHVHVVEEELDLGDGNPPVLLRDWHFGSDSARVVAATPSTPHTPASAWIVCADLERRRCLCSFLVALPSDIPAPAAIQLTPKLLSDLGVRDSWWDQQRCQF